MKHPLTTTLSLHVALSVLCVSLPIFYTCAYAQTETLDVHAPRQVQVQLYQKVGRFYRRFAQLPEQDRAGLSLNVMGRVQPSNKPLPDANLHLQTQTGSLPLSQPGSDALRFPLSDALWQENPPIMATLAPNEHIHFTFQIAVQPAQANSFSNAQAQAWLKQLDFCVKDVVGTVFSWLVPHAKIVTVTLAAHSTLTVTNNDQPQTLFENTQNTPQTYALEPKKFAPEATFTATQPFTHIMLTMPVNLHADLKRKS